MVDECYDSLPKNSYDPSELDDKNNEINTANGFFRARSESGKENRMSKKRREEIEEVRIDIDDV